MSLLISRYKSTGKSRRPKWLRLFSAIPEPELKSSGLSNQSEYLFKICCHCSCPISKVVLLSNQALIKYYSYDKPLHRKSTSYTRSHHLYLYRTDWPSVTEREGTTCDWVQDKGEFKQTKGKCFSIHMQGVPSQVPHGQLTRKRSFRPQNFKYKIEC